MNDSPTLVDVNFSFLTTGPTLGFLLPSQFTRLPKLVSPLYIQNFSGARSFYFIPAGLDDGMTGHKLVKTDLDGDGRTVEVFERPQLPKQWWIRWTLDGGFLYTFREEEDGLDGSSEECAALSIVEDEATGIPFLLPSPPLRIAVAGAVGFGEHASFESKEPNSAIAIRRPGFLEEGKVMIREDGDLVFLRAGAAMGCEVKISAAKDEPVARELASLVADSLHVA